MNYGLMKSGFGECSVDVALAAPSATVPEVGVLNYQARDFIRDALRVGDGVLPLRLRPARPRRHGARGVHTLPWPDAV